MSVPLVTSDKTERVHREEKCIEMISGPFVPEKSTSSSS